MKIKDLSLNKEKNELNLRDAALGLFSEVFLKIDAEIAVSESVRLKGSTLSICNESFELNQFPKIYVIGFGKAAMKIAIGLDKILSEKITQGIISAPKRSTKLTSKWKVFIGGHPLPNKASLMAGKAAIDLLKRANHPQSLIVFLISGGGSAMLELPKDEKILLKDLQKINQVLVSCGATINEINKFRKSLSQIKGGGLSRIAPLARQVSLIISDTNRDDEASVASGPTISNDENADLILKAKEIAAKYQLLSLLPDSVRNFLEESETSKLKTSNLKVNNSFFTLLDNRKALESIADSAKNLGYIIELSDDLVETPIEEGCRELIKRLLKLGKENKGKYVALISGGEFVCPVKGNGIGGRNLETTLRCLLEFEKQADERFDLAILSAGTDGIDGNSPVAGAVADNTSLSRAKELRLNPEEYLANSDSYNFFSKLGDVIVTGATGTNVRDIRILLGRNY